MKIDKKALKAAFIINVLVVACIGFILSTVYVFSFQDEKSFVKGEMTSKEQSYNYMCTHLREGYYEPCDLKGLIGYNMFPMWFVGMFLAYFPIPFGWINYLIIIILYFLFKKSVIPNLFE
jgi:hypothetical protein